MEVEWLILADAAQVVGGKLFLLGGGWETLMVASGFPTQQHAAVAASFRVPWNETNQRHYIQVEVVDEAGNEALRLQAQVEVGRPAGVPGGCDQRAQIALNGIVPIKRPGTYVVIARVEGVEQKRVAFRVIAASTSPGTGGRGHA